METIDRIRSALEETPEVVFGLLFGSRARGTARSGSDWDVAVHLAEGVGPEERFELRRRLTATLSGEETVDVVVLNDAPPLLAHRALQGRLLLVRDERAYVRFFVRTMGEADDDRHFLQIHADERNRRLREGTFGRP